MLKSYPHFTALVLSTGLSLLVGCVSSTSQQTRFYRLNPEAGSVVGMRQAESMATSQPKVGVGPVHLASYLDRPQLINRTGPYQLTINDFDHWAGTLQDNITRGLVAALQARLGGDAVIAYPWHSAVRPAYELVLDFTRFDAQQGQLVLKVRWTLLEDRGDKLLEVRQMEISEPIEGTAPEALVAAASQALDRLAEKLTGVMANYP